MIKTEDETKQFNASEVDFKTIFPGDSIINKLRKAKEEMLPFDFWSYLPEEARNGDPETALLDIQSVNAVLQVYDSLSDKNKQKLLWIADGNPFVLAGFCWEFLGDIKHLKTK